MRAQVIVVALTLAAGCGIAAGCVAPLLEPLEPQLVFRPRGLDAEYASSLAHARRIEQVTVTTPDGVHLRGWLRHPEHWTPGRRHPLVIVYGGIGQEVSEIAALAQSNADWGWLAINYRGFGLSEGSPNERIVLQDAKRIYDWALARPDVDGANIVVLGRSLGTYVAIAVAAARKVRAAILATPFDSAAALGEDHYGVPLAWLVQDHFNPALIAPLVSAPALFVLAEKDRVTPVKHGLALASRWGGIVKTVLLPGLGHHGLEDRPEFWNSIGDFLAALDRPALTSTADLSVRPIARLIPPR
ncbi:MAG TPA: alpha/beta fold hydrolase [Burkholderiales bacterium]|nr:alpha/beta fold hydrolase [Burkholderiales bacterium]